MEHETMETVRDHYHNSPNIVQEPICECHAKQVNNFTNHQESDQKNDEEQEMYETKNIYMSPD